jgi:hypothetical protein
MIERLKQNIGNNRYAIWYGLCALLLGIIDQRRGSAPGNVQMLFANLVGVAVFLLSLPSFDKEFFRCRRVQIGIGAVWMIAGAAVLVIRPYVNYWGAANAAIVSGACVVIMLSYILWNRKVILRDWKIHKAGYGMIMLALLLMLLSVNTTVWPGFYLLLFGCFYLIGIPRELQDQFTEGLLGGLALWFVGQQCIACALRPYDFVRYKGLYLGETQSGLFYMIAFCAFAGLWMYARQKQRKKRWRFLLFVMAAGCGSLLLLTGSKSSLAGLVVGAWAGYLLYDVVMCGSFKHWFWQWVMTGACMLVLIPAAYGCVRYLPTVLHHPIWFAGEYNDEKSVRSFDPWNSERYVTFERAVNRNLGRILKVVGITMQYQDGELHINTPFSIKADAEEYIEPGSSKEHPYLQDGEVNTKDGTLDPARVAIWTYFFRHLNWEGHTAGIFYYRSDNAFGNAHNMFLHIAFLYGILPGLLFLVWNVWCLIRLVRRRDMTGIVGAMMMIAIMTYGMFEQATTTGQITLSLLFVLNYFGMEKLEKPDKLKKNV